MIPKSRVAEADFNNGMRSNSKVTIDLGPYNRIILALNNHQSYHKHEHITRFGYWDTFSTCDNLDLWGSGNKSPTTAGSVRKQRAPFSTM